MKRMIAACDHYMIQIQHISSVSANWSKSSQLCLTFMVLLNWDLIYLILLLLFWL